MAIAERPRPGWASYHSPHTNNCQELGNSILLLFGLIICINIGINLVTLLWCRLRYFLRRVFNIVCVKEAPKSSGKQTTSHPSRKQSPPEVHLRCTMDPVKMTMTLPPSHCRHHRNAPKRRAHCPVTWTPYTDYEKPLPHHPAICSHNWDCPENWEGFQPTQEIWTSWAQATMEPPAQTIRFQHTAEERPLKTEVRSEVGLEAYVYPVNPPPPSPEALSHKNSGAEAEAPPPVLGPAFVPDITRCRSSGRVAYDARDVRRRLRELTQEVESSSHCYPLPSGSSIAEKTGQGWIYHSLAGR